MLLIYRDYNERAPSTRLQTTILIPQESGRFTVAFEMGPFLVAPRVSTERRASSPPRLLRTTKGVIQSAEQSFGLLERVLRALTRYSNVRGISRMDLTPAQTTATGVRPSSVRSDEISMPAQGRSGTENELPRYQNPTSRKHLTAVISLVAGQEQDMMNRDFSQEALLFLGMTSLANVCEDEDLQKREMLY
jgi:hypothetical protein